MRLSPAASSARPAPSSLRYTLKIVKRIRAILMLMISLVTSTFAADQSFSRLRVAGPNGKQLPATLTFSDQRHALEVHLEKGDSLITPYSEIYKFSYEYTKRRRISEGTLIAAPVGIGALMMLTKGKSHWLEIDYDDQNIRKAYVLRMDKHDYVRILEAIKAHTGKDADILGNANKR